MNLACILQATSSLIRYARGYNIGKNVLGVTKHFMIGTKNYQKMELIPGTIIRTRICSQIGHGPYILLNGHKQNLNDLSLHP